MSYVKNDLIPGEKLIYETGLHWSVLVWPVIIAVIVAASGVVCLLQKDTNFLYAGAALLVVALGIVAVAIFRRSAVEMAVTNRRVIIKTGLASRRSLEIMLAKVESIGIEESAMGRMFGYGTLTIHGTGGTPEPFSRIAHPSEFRREVQQQVAAQQSPQN
ncbi:MAG TPA: PH domain-containing protein [Candidatus Acidoferrales bacterium]|nr:PH domain-containing protein [Candidatus Acidoferrales bacterium]